MTLPLRYRYFIASLFMGHLYEDHNLQESNIRESRLDWTIVRPGSFIDGSRTGSYQHGFTADNNTITVKISRADVADFMMRQLADNDYLNKAPGISY